jgi:hypothetical protein
MAGMNLGGKGVFQSASSQAPFCAILWFYRVTRAPLEGVCLVKAGFDRRTWGPGHGQACHSRCSQNFATQTFSVGVYVN